MPTASLRPIKPDQFDYWKAQHLLNRAGFGGTPSQARALTSMGLNDAVDYIVNYDDVETTAVEPDEFDRDIMHPLTDEQRQQMRRARREGDEATLGRFREQRQERQRKDRRQMASIQRWWMKRLIESPRPLEEKMTLFWHGHFATSYRAIEDSYHMFRQNQLFRTHATGNFKALTHAIIRDPAMLRYLNNDQNRRSAPNENLARELMELFTLGEGHDYTEKDIKEGARALTGYTFADDSFVFRPRLHDNDEKRILGKRGDWDGHDFVDIIFERPATSEFLCWKLYRFLVNDRAGTPDKETQQFILKLARELRRAKWDMRPMLTALFRSQHFYDDQNMGSMIKSPVQLTVQAVRSLRTPTRRLNALMNGQDLMGQNLFFPPSVKGWPGGRTWINTATLYVRQNMLVYLLTGQRPDAYEWDRDGSAYDAMHLIEHLAGPDGTYSVRDVATYLLRFNIGGQPHHERVDTLVKFVEQHGERIDNDMLIALLLLITATPEYQLC